MADRKLRIDIWTPECFDSDGGIQAHSRDLITALRETPEVAELRILQYFEAGNGLGKLWHQISFLLRALRNTLSPPDAIFITHVDLTPVAAWISRIHPVPYVVSCHGIEVWRDLPQSKVQALQAAQLLLCVSRFTRSRLLEDFSIPETQTLTFPNTTHFPQDETDTTSARQHLITQYQIPESDHIIFTLGRMRPADREKGYGRLWQAVEMLNQSETPTTLIAAGSGPDTRWLEQQAAAAQLADKLKCPGRISDQEVTQHYQGCDLFALPSTKEGFGIVLLEALAQGTPVLAGNQDGSTEPTLNGKCGILCDPTAPADIAAKLTEFFCQSDHPLRDRRFLRTTAESHFGQDAYRQRLAAVLKRVI